MAEDIADQVIRIVERRVLPALGALLAVVMLVWVGSLGLVYVKVMLQPSANSIVLDKGKWKCSLSWPTSENGEDKENCRKYEIKE